MSGGIGIHPSCEDWFGEVEVAGGPALLWLAGHGWQMLSSAVTGGGFGNPRWVLNVQVPVTYARMDPARHIAELADELGLSGPGVGMLTAAWVRRFTTAEHGGVRVTATTGLSRPIWAADEYCRDEPALPGTINIIAQLPVRLSQAALVNAVITATEAKSQAMIEAGMPGTGTASDAVCVASPTTGEAANFCGPRSYWGARLAIACHRAVTSGIDSWAADHPELDPRRPRPR